MILTTLAAVFALAFPPSITAQPAFVQVKADKITYKPVAKVLVAVIDTGVDAFHPDLGYSLSNGYDVLQAKAAQADTAGHGTGVAGVITALASTKNTEFGVWVMPVKASNTTSLNTATIYDALVYASDNGAKVINLSLGSWFLSPSVRFGVTYAQNKGCLVVCSAGNEGKSALNYPAALPRCISVAAVDSTGKLTNYSQFGAWVSVAAPGENILSAKRGGGYGGYSGTSIATPIVAAEAAMLWAQFPKLSADQVRSIITSSTNPVVKFRSIAGGIVDFQQAFAKAQKL